MTKTALPAGDWVTHDAPRVAPLSTEDLGRLHRGVLAYIRRKTGDDEDYNVFRTFARLGGVFPVHALLVGRLLEDGRLPSMEKEQVILRVAWRLGCQYEWVHHHHLAIELGITPATIAGLAEPAPTGVSERVLTMLEVADELVETRLIAEASWAAARAVLDEDELLELCFLVGHYVMVAMTINAVGVQPEASFLPAEGER